MRIVLIPLLTFGFVPVTWGETLGDLLLAHKIPESVVTEKDRRLSIMSFAVSSDNSPFLLAYYEDDGSGLLPPLLRVIRYDGQTGSLHRAELRGVEEPFRSSKPGEERVHYDRHSYQSVGRMPVDSEL